MAETGLHEMSKRDVFLALMEQGLTMIHLDPRHEGVDVPDSLAQGPTLRLNLSYRFNIPDFLIEPEGISCTLHFPDAGNHHCKVPWPALYGVTSQVSKDGRMWMESMPIEVRLDLARRAVMLLGQMHASPQKSPDLAAAPLEGEPNDEVEELPPARPAGPNLRVIDGGAEDPLLTEGEEPSPPPPARKRPKLRLLK